MLAIGIIVLGIASRLVFHAPNYTPVIALALFSGTYLRRSYGWSVPLLLMIISDILIGMHPTIPYTWGSIVVIALAGQWLRTRKNFKNVTLAGLAASILFFVVTNFGSWLCLYPQNAEGFVACFVAAIPFFNNSLISTMVYAWLLYGAYEYFAAKFRSSSWGRVLLSA